jgi:hypothetical protein
MRPRVTLLCCTLVVLAGCGAFGGESTRTPTPEVTPVPVPDDGVLAPGLTSEGVESPSRLAEAHARLVEERSFRLAANRTVRYANGSLRSHLSVRVATDTNRTYLARAETAGHAAPVFLGRPPATGVYWSDGTTFVRKLTRDGETTYNEFGAPTGGAGSWGYWTKTVPFGGGRATPESFYADLFAAVPTRVAGRITADESPAYRLVGTRTPGGLRGAVGSGIEDVRDLRLDATVTDEGLVRSLSLSYAGRVDGEAVQVSRTVRYRNVGATDVTRPAWYARAVRGGTETRAGGGTDAERDAENGTAAHSAVVEWP